LKLFLTYIAQTLHSFTIRNFFQQFSVKLLFDTYSSFYNKSKIQALIRTEVLKKYPEGVSWAGKYKLQTVRNRKANMF
jgi:hypothetical protein